MSLANEAANLPVPNHIAIIMDGNGRWAKGQGKMRIFGHQNGVGSVRAVSEACAELGVKNLTLYAFSTENWKRPEKEVAAIMNLFRDYLNEAQDREDENEQKGLRIRYVGEREGLADDIIALIDTLEKGSADKKTTVNIAVNYGGRNEILHSVKKIAAQVEAGELKAEDIDLKNIEDNLFIAGQPDPDLIIRPSGEYRLSNFLIWQAAYSEFWFSDILWPDFTEDDLDKAIIDFCKRNRRFGGV